MTLDCRAALLAAIACGCGGRQSVAADAAAPALDGGAHVEAGAPADAPGDASAVDVSGEGSQDSTSATNGETDGATDGEAGSAVGVRWLGRADTSAAPPGTLGRFAWSASGFVATLSGSRISVQLQTEGDTPSAFFQPVVDGTPGARFQVVKGAAQTVVLADGLSSGDHLVELYRESEGMYGDDILLGFPDGTLRAPPAPPNGRLIEIVGDSISAGYGNLGSATHPPWTNGCSFSLDTESAYQAYGSMVARALGAEVSIIAHSGWGMYRDRNDDTSNVVPTIYENTLGVLRSPTWSFAREPQAVVIDLGTNDSATGDPGQPFEDAYVTFLHTVRRHYPSAWIFLTIGPMTDDPLLSAMRAHLSHVVTAAADARVTTVDLAAQDTSSTGCDYHPNVAEDATMAAVLTSAIRTKLGW